LSVANSILQAVTDSGLNAPRVSSLQG